MLEYGCTVWDLYSAYQKLWLEQVQRREARFVSRTYTREEECVTNALKRLNWPTLKKRRQVARLTDVQMCYQPDRYRYPRLCTSSVFPKNQIISSTEIYPTSAIL